jgi:hypothetical protein
MQETVSALLAQYERGLISRREAVTTLAAVVTGGIAASAAPLSGAALDHLGLQVSDLDPRCRSGRVESAVAPGELPNPRPSAPTESAGRAVTSTCCG